MCLFLGFFSYSWDDLLKNVRQANVNFFFKAFKEEDSRIVPKVMPISNDSEWGDLHSLQKKGIGLLKIKP